MNHMSPLDLTISDLHVEKDAAKNITADNLYYSKEYILSQ